MSVAGWAAWRERVASGARLVPVLAAYALLVGVGIALRPLLPVDETRYATVAWEMWIRGEWLLPQLNGLPYDHKPPLLFWLIHLGWALFGVNDWWPRLLGPLLTVLDCALLATLARRLWPERVPLRRLGPALFLGTWMVALYSTGLMFDMLLLACVLGAWLALWHAASGGGRGALIAFAACAGAGVLAKGPVMLMYTLPLALSAPWWFAAPRRLAAAPWLARVTLALLAGMLIPLLWVGAVAQLADHEFLRRVLIDQTVDRISGRIGHGRPWYWYLERLPLLAMPWLFWPPVWRAWVRMRGSWREPALRFVALGVAIPLLLFSLVGGKQLHYMLPLVALAALLTARLLLDVPALRGLRDAWLPALWLSPLVLIGLIVGVRQTHLSHWLTTWSPALVWLAAIPALLVLAQRHRGVVAATLGLAFASLLFMVVLVADALRVATPRYDLTDAARHVAAQQRAGRPVAMLAGSYQGELGFLGRIERPLVVLRAAAVHDWLVAHPDGLLIARSKRLELSPAAHLEHSQPYKTDRLLMVGAREALESGARFSD
jgi:4-amino-4-deoxy-L-arabinose transferase-like glycosyltransferase